VFEKWTKSFDFFTEKITISLIALPKVFYESFIYTGGIF